MAEAASKASKRGWIVAVAVAVVAAAAGVGAGYALWSPPDWYRDRTPDKRAASMPNTTPKARASFATPMGDRPALN